jgi:hypothetical protein
LQQRGLQLGALEFLVKADVTPRQLTTNVDQMTGALPTALA